MEPSTAANLFENIAAAEEQENIRPEDQLLKETFDDHFAPSNSAVALELASRNRRQIHDAVEDEGLHWSKRQRVR